MSNSLQNYILNTLNDIFNNDKPLSRLTPKQAIILAQKDLICVSNGNITLTEKAERYSKRLQKQQDKSRILQTVAFACGLIKQGQGFTIKPKNKSTDDSPNAILPLLSSTSITRQQALEALNTLVKLGHLDDNSHDIKNNFQYQYFHKGTYTTPDNLITEPQNSKPKEDMIIQSIND